MVIPSCPWPSEQQAAALQMAALLHPDVAEAEKKRAVYCCRIEVIKGSDRADLCIELLEELE